MHVHRPTFTWPCALLAATTLAAGCAGARSAPVPAAPIGWQERAAAGLRDAQGASVGNATVTATAGGLLVALEVHNLPAGVHGIHLHAVGRCEGPTFASAGAHVNPMTRRHGLESPEGPHAGDLPNLTVAQDGTARETFFLPGLTLGSGATALLDADGTAVVIHAAPDDQRSDPAGNSGGRIACGVLARPPVR